MGVVTNPETQQGRVKHNTRPNRESIAKTLGSRALQIKARDGHKCAYCGATEREELRRGRKMHLDHVLPKAEGGKVTNKNVLVACHRCNSAKKKLSFDEWHDHAHQLGIRFSAKAVLDRLKQKVPSMEEARVSEAKMHEQRALDHEKHPDVPSHVHAAKLNRIAARVLRQGGGWASQEVKDARKASDHAWEVGRKGGRFYLDTKGHKQYAKH